MLSFNVKSNTVITKNFSKLRLSLSLTLLISTILFIDDLDKAFSTFEMLSVKYKSTPLKNELTKALIASDDKNKLNKLIEIGSKAHGAMNMYSDLMFSYLEMDRVQDAKRILENHLAFCPQEKIITKCSR